MNGIFVFLAALSFVGIVLGLIKPSLTKLKSRKQVSIIFGCMFAIFFTIVIATISPSPKNGASTTPSSITVSPEELPLYIGIAINKMRTSTKTTDSDLKELSLIPALNVQDKWNEEMGYSENLSPESYSPLTDFQVGTILSVIQELRKEHGDKWFDVMIFDDSTIAKEARAADYSKLSDQRACAKLSHFRGAYSWNPTNQHEEMNLMIDCNWQSLLHQ